jgi:hypothetical protein
MYFYLYIYCFFNPKNKEVILNLKDLIKKRENLINISLGDTKKKLFFYSKLFFRKFVREKVLKTFNKRKSTNKVVGNLLTYFFLRYKKRFKRIKRIPRLKKLH